MDISDNIWMEEQGFDPNSSHEYKTSTKVLIINIFFQTSN